MKIDDELLNDIRVTFDRLNVNAGLIFKTPVYRLAWLMDFTIDTVENGVTYED